VICLDEFGPLNLGAPTVGQGRAPHGRPRRIRATYTPHGVEAT